MQKTIRLKTMTLIYDFSEKAVKRLNLRVRADGSVTLSAPYGTPQGAIDAFLRSKEAWLASARSARQGREEKPLALTEGSMLSLFGIPQHVRIQKGKTNAISWDGRCLLFTLKKPEDERARQRLFKAWQTELCRQVVLPFYESHRAYYEKKGAPRDIVFSFRRMKTRWGSCQPAKGRISFNTLLTEKPLAFIEYVVVHELTHFLHPNHSPDFYRALSAVLPDYEQRKTL